MAKITGQVQVGAGTRPRAAPSWFTEPSSPSPRDETCVAFGYVTPGKPAHGNLLSLSPFHGEAVKRFPGKPDPVSATPWSLHRLRIADRPRAGRFKAKSRAEGSQKTARSPSAALAQGHLSLSHTAKRRQLGRANVFLFSNISFQIGGCAWVAPKGR